MLVSIRHAVFASVVTIVVLVLGGATAQQLEETATPPDAIDYSMFFMSDIRDAAECQVTVVDGTTLYGPSVTNPSITCPDAFAWNLFAEVIRAGFWENWSTDRQVWPSDPWPRCVDGANDVGCCSAITESNEPAPLNCPVNPGTTPGAPAHAVVAPSKAHAMTMQAATNSEAGTWADVPDALKNAVISSFRDELIYRNPAMVDYIFDNELYYVEGLKRVFDTYMHAIAAYAPYRPQEPDPTQTHASAPPIAKVEFPIDAQMIKITWLRVDLAEQVGIDPYDTENPFIMMDLKSDFGAADGDVQRYILLSMHISSKDLPNWFWTTFEHVANQGRCDWLGCNDSFGYITTQTIDVRTSDAAGLPPPELNYIPPHKLAGVDNSSVRAFDLAQPYLGVDSISDELAALLDAYDVGTSDEPNASGLPTQQDAAWRSYRLKGTQVDWVTSTGRITRLGNSVTEAGFVNSASCISCHAQAAVTQEGLPAYAIFETSLSDVGLAKSVNGTVDPDLFETNAYFGLDGEFESLSVNALQTDFVWGIRFACPINKIQLGPSWCANVTGPGYASPLPAVPADDDE